jgi:hypothetical protein
VIDVRGREVIEEETGSQELKYSARKKKERQEKKVPESIDMTD